MTEDADLNAVLYRCGRCGGQWTAPPSHDSRNCGDCRHDEPMERIGTVDKRPDGWEDAGRTLEHGELEKGYRVSFEHERRAEEPASIFNPFSPEDCDERCEPAFPVAVTDGGTK